MSKFFGISALAEGSFWSRFSDFFSPEFNQYDNIPINEESFVSIKFLIIGMSLGIVAASVSAIYNRRVLGRFIRAIIKADATSPEKAKTLAELGFEKNAFVISSLRSGCTLKNSTSCVEYDEFLREAEEKAAEEKGDEAEAGDSKKKRYKLSDRDFIVDVSSAHFYIPEEKKYSMEIKFEEKGTNILTFILSLVFAAAFAIASVIFLPDILQLVDNFINIFK